MRYTFLYHTSKNKRLVLLFAGWSAEPEWFDGVQPDGYDLMVVTDYRSSYFESKIFDELAFYKEIVIVSWSFGVPAASRFILNNPTLPITLRLAINGTTKPIDNNQGIPEHIFEGTLNNLSLTTLKKFDRRMCGKGVVLPRRRNIEELAEELRTIRSEYSGAYSKNDTACWDIAIIGDSDNIIPPDNQQRAWEGYVKTEVIHAPHFPDFKTLLNQKLIHKQLVAEKFGKTATEGSYNDNATVQGHIALQLSKRLLETTYKAWLKRPLKCLEIGTGTGILTRLYYPALNIKSELTHCDLSHISDTLPGKRIIADAETYIRSLQDNSLDLILGASVIQWFHSPLRFLEECYRILNPGGMVILSTFSPDNFPELVNLVDRRLSGPSADEWDNKLKGLFSEHTVEEETVPLHFPSSRHLLAHMKSTGVNGLSGDPTSSQRATRAILRSDLTILTYHPIYLYARKEGCVL